MKMNCLGTACVSGLRCSVCLTALACALGLTLPASGYVSGNLLVDSDYEINPLINFVSILGPPYTTGLWGAENGTITGAASGIIPVNTGGTKMLSLLSDGLVANQAFQLVDLSAYAGPINANAATLVFNAGFNVPAAVPSSVSFLYLNYYDAAHNPVGPLSGLNYNPDNLVSTWEFPFLYSSVPVNAKYVLAQVAYNNASMTVGNVNYPGYVDAGSMWISYAPEPSAFVLAALASLGGLLTFRRT